MSNLAVAALRATTNIADCADYKDYRGLRHTSSLHLIDIASVRTGSAGALMIDHRSDKHLIAFQEAFVRVVIDHQCGRRPRTDATEAKGIRVNPRNPRLLLEIGER